MTCAYFSTPFSVEYVTSRAAECHGFGRELDQLVDDLLVDRRFFFLKPTHHDHAPSAYLFRIVWPYRIPSFVDP